MDIEDELIHQKKKEKKEKKKRKKEKSYQKNSKITIKKLKM